MRQARLHIPGVVHHLIWRFVESRWFVSTDDDRARYLRLLGRALEESDWRCVAFAIMSNHVHIAAIAGREPLASWSRRVNVPFAQAVNDDNGRFGPVFANRARDYAISPARVAEVIGYIHNNPVRAGVVARARDSNWTSHGEYVEARAPLRWLHAAEGLALTKLEPEAFDAFVDGHPPDPERPNRRAIVKALQPYGQINLATPFDRQFPLVIRPFGRVRPDPRRVVELVCAAVGIAPVEVMSRRRWKPLMVARAAVVHCGLAAGVSGADIGSVLGVTQQAISWTARNVAPPRELCERVFEQLLREARAELICNRPSAA